MVALTKALYVRAVAESPITPNAIHFFIPVILLVPGKVGISRIQDLTVFYNIW